MGSDVQATGQTGQHMKQNKQLETSRYLPIIVKARGLSLEAAKRGTLPPQPEACFLHRRLCLERSDFRQGKCLGITRAQRVREANR